VVTSPPPVTARMPASTVSHRWPVPFPLSATSTHATTSVTASRASVTAAKIRDARLSTRPSTATTIAIDVIVR